MPHKKDPQPTGSSENQALEQRVDDMMDIKRPDPLPAATPTEMAAGPPIDIFKDPKTAPEVPDKLLEQIGAQKPDAQAANKLGTAPPPATNQPVTPETVIAPRSEQLDAKSTELEDATTDNAVDDIVANEGDTVLATEDAANKPPLKSNSPSWKSKLLALVKNKWTWLGLVVILAVLMALPAARYKILGLFIKESLSVSVIDSKTATPVSNAVVSLSGKSSKTDAKGQASLKVPVGSSTLVVTKQYYTTSSIATSVSLRPTAVSVHLVATGRQVPITVKNRITGQPLANAEIKVLNTTAKTDTNGTADIVLPTSAASDKATVGLSGFNTADVSVTVTSSVVSGNTFELTPSGHIYFLSNLSGTIDVVETNLDGSGRQTVFAGTGKEDPNTTSLLAARDWRFMVLKTQRAGSQSALYLIDASTNKVTAFDNSNANFNLIGWDGHDFLYELQSNALQQSQSGKDVIKSYNADTLQLNQLDQNQAQGTATSYAYQVFSNFYILNNQLAYTTQWYTYDSAGGSYDVSSLLDSIRAVQPNGLNKKDYQTFAVSGVSNIQAALYEPQAAYYAVYYSSSANATKYYSFTNQTVSALGNLAQTDFTQPYPTYLLSPSGMQTFWSELRDGKNTLFIGDADAQNKKQTASLTNYAPYGWFSDNYILVSQSSSQLYIMPASGLTATQQPLKITDYYKPAQSYVGYGYGYGGL